MKIKQVIPGDGRIKTVSRTATAGTPGSVQLVVEVPYGAPEATVDITLTATGQLWVNTRGSSSTVVLVATLDEETCTWNHDVDAQAR